MPFDKLDEPTENGNWQERSAHLYHWLAGILNIYDQGRMHRDITPQNLLVWPIDENKDKLLKEHLLHRSSPSHQLPGVHLLYLTQPLLTPLTPRTTPQQCYTKTC